MQTTPSTRQICDGKGRLCRFRPAPLCLHSAVPAWVLSTTRTRRTSSASRKLATVPGTTFQDLQKLVPVDRVRIRVSGVSAAVTRGKSRTNIEATALKLTQADLGALDRVTRPQRNTARAFGPKA